MIIGVDVDDVCADLISAWLKRYNTRFGDSLTPDQIRRWEITNYATRCTPHEFFELLSPDIYDEVQPVEGALFAVDAMRSFGRVVFITSGNADAKLAWLQRHGFLRSLMKMDPDFIAATDKTLIRGAEVLIDDHVKNVEAFPNSAFLVTKPHNEDLSCFRPRVRDLAHAAECVRSLRIMGFY